MDERLLHHYNNELRHLREMAGDFAREFPKIAGRLALDSEGRNACQDPYVERLLEGFAYLAARVHVKLDAEFPRLAQGILETVYPHYLCPLPSMAVVGFEPDEQEAGLAQGLIIPRHSLLRGRSERTPCTFQTAQDIRLLPVRVTEARYFTRDLAELRPPPNLRLKAAIRLRLQATAGLAFDKIKLDPLVFFIRGVEELPCQIYEQIFARGSGLIVQSPADRNKVLGCFPAASLQQVGFSHNQALLPLSPRSFEGYRLLREYFAFPQRFLFFELSGFHEAARLCKTNQLDLVIPLAEADPALENKLNSSFFRLFCTPIINLFSRHCDRIPLSDRFSELHVVPDRQRPLDFEVFDIETVTGYGTTAAPEQTFQPFYLARDAELAKGAFYSIQRAPRMLTDRERRVGRSHSDYTGTEIYLSLVDATAAPYRPELRQLGVKALCTNRHLPISMTLGVEQSDFTMEANAPVATIRCLSGPTYPRASHVEGRFTWQLISHLSLNYLSLLNAPDGPGAVALREILKLYSDTGDRQATRQIEGLLNCGPRPIIRRVRTPGPIAFARGLEVTLEFDELAFQGTGVFLLGAVLDRFFAKYVSLNSFTETVIKTQQRGEIMRWPARVGKRYLL